MSLKCTIRVVEARGIKASDLNGKSDPYVKINIKGSSKIQQTRILYKTLTPIWNEEFVIQPVSQSDVLEITLWDKDAFKDDHLGGLQIPLSSYMNQMRDEWKPILERQHGMKGHAFKMMTGAAPMKAHGEIHLQVYVGSGAPPSNQMGAQQHQQTNQLPNQQNPYLSQPTGQYGQQSQPTSNPYITQTPVVQPPQSHGAQPPNPYLSQPAQYGMQSVGPSQPAQYGMQPTSQPPQYGMQSAPQSQPPQYGMQPPSNSYPPSQPAQYGMQSAPQQQYQAPNQNAYGAQPPRPQYSSQTGSYPSQYPQNTPGAQISLPSVQYPVAVQPNQYRGEDSGSFSQFPDQWGPKPDFSTLNQPNPYGAM